MRKKRYFRYSENLRRAGVSEAWQHIIYGELTKRKTPEEAERIRRLCDKTGGEWSEALYRFLTDTNVNHVYICNEYKIPKRTLFSLKHRFYTEWPRE